MEQNRQNLLNRLRAELEFVKSGGYRRSPRSPWRAPYIFEESPSCPNFTDRTRPHACQDCWLMEFVRPELREEQAPCRFVELADGITVDSLYRFGTPAETEEILTKWLQARIYELEIELRDRPNLNHLTGTGSLEQTSFRSNCSRRHSA